MTLLGFPLQVVIMATVGAVLALVGVALLVRLTKPASPGKVYAYRMIGVMTLTGGIALLTSAYAMWGWSLES